MALREKVRAYAGSLTEDDQLLFTIGYHTDLALLILGETGVGKTHLARLVHDGSLRREGPFVVADCGSITESLFDSELFGHRKGAFTGAVNSNDGLVAMAEGGTLFLDEVGNLPASSQAKLLRLIEAKSYRSVGDSRERSANVRIIAATNLDVERAMRDGRLREDLYYRLSTVEPVRIRPLRDRSGAIPDIAASILERRARSAGIPSRFSEPALDWAARQSWPGNVRQLKGAIEVAYELARVRWMAEPADAERIVHLQDMVRAAGDRSPADDSHGRNAAPLSIVADAEVSPASGRGVRAVRLPPTHPMHRDYVIEILERAGNNQSRAASIAGVSRRTIVNWIERYQLPRPRVLSPENGGANVFHMHSDRRAGAKESVK